MARFYNLSTASKLQLVILSGDYAILIVKWQCYVVNARYVSYNIICKEPTCLVEPKEIYDLYMSCMTYNGPLSFRRIMEDSWFLKHRFINIFPDYRSSAFEKIMKDNELIIKNSTDIKKNTLVSEYHDIDIIC